VKILLVRLRLIGDVVFTTPAVRAIRERFPDAELTYLVEPAAAPVVAENPNLDIVIVAPRQRGARSVVADWQLGARLRAARYDLAIDFHGGPRASLLTWLSRARVRIGYQVAGRSWMYTTRVARPRVLRPRHSVVNQWDLLEPLGIGPPDPARYPAEMTASADAIRSVSARLAQAGITPADSLIVVHVSANSPFRRWPEASFRDAIVALARGGADRRIVVTSGPSDAAAAGSIIDATRRALGSRAAQILACGEFSIVELRALLERAHLFIGGDSGPLHVASTTGVPIVGIYGPTLPVRSGPWRSSSFPTASLEPGPLACRPCDQRVCVPGDFRCLTRVTLDAVVRAAELLLDPRSTVASRGEYPIRDKDLT
jgi:ADP-heptose:LPS heptosyltransferase